MAGKELYIQPILDSSLSSLTSNISSMNTQLSETTRILMNILNNQGLEQHQSAYTGATFSALTINTDTTAKYNIDITEHITVVNNNTVHSASYSNQKIEINTGDNLNLTGVTEIVLTNSVLWSYNFKLLTLYINENESININVQSKGTYVGAFTIPQEYQTRLYKIEFSNFTAYDPFDVTIQYTGGTFEIKEVAHLAFNSSNILTWAVSNNLLQPLCSESKTAYITIPDIQGVATWVSTLLKGNLEGVSVALVDNTTHDLIKVLPTATSDISDVQQLSGLALMVTFAGDGNALKYMSGFTMRYY